MKKLILFLILLTALVSCSADNDNNEVYTYEILPVESYEVPASFTLGETYKIYLNYQMPTTCHLFQGIYYDKYLNIRTIAIRTMVKDNICTTQFPPISQVSFNFFVTNSGSYIFKFYKGMDTDGKAIFEEVEIPVTD